MKVRYVLVAVLMLVGAVAIAGFGDECTIEGTIASVFDINFVTSSLDLGALPTGGGTYDGTLLGKFLHVTMKSNENYTVQVSCSGNLAQENNVTGRYEIETEYAIWKSSKWNDNLCQQPGGSDTNPYTGYLSDLVGTANAFYHNSDPIWFEAQAYNTFAAGGKVDDNTATTLQMFNNINYVPSKYLIDDTDRYHFRYNHGSNSEMKIYPCLTIYQDYGTPAGSYSGTVTIIVTQAPSWETVPPNTYAP